ncbi:ribosome recycling factor [Pelagibaculum spongiae]|uniref:Ribosome-recycling factor n=1 Tax=Pelagibaculum spongiae TaxID=2080658 RepID=A0A2V1GPU2_9GAMM|nr:ribosome recycling factor [Pelagibaculum spongiae]PVZ64911.1 ribosome recycling factor [Pelagibaculum spongiae]
MIDEILEDSQQRMAKSLEALEHNLSKMRTGRAHPSLLEGIMVPYYGVDTPLKQVANVSIGDARTLTIQVWEKTLVSAVEKAIMTSNLGLNPCSAGEIIRVPLPVLTEERRREMVKLVRHEGENSKVSVRNARRDANSDFKELVKEKEASEDDERRAQESVQKLTDRYVAEIDKRLDAKEAELMEV